LIVWGLVLRLDQAWEPMRVIVVQSAQDDAFYYFQIARNITHGAGATLDGETVTTGFHPLWLFLTLPLFALDNRELPVHLALSVGAMLGALTTWIVFEIVRRLVTNQRAALLAAGLFALHPMTITYSVNGLETSLTLFAIALAVLVFIETWRQEAPSPRHCVVFGVLGALMVLARTDTVVAFAFMLAALALRDAGHRWRDPAISGAVAAMLVAPWLAWSLLATGSVVQDSALAGGQMARNLYFFTHDDSFWPNIKHGLDEVRWTLKNRLPSAFIVPIPRSTTPFWITVFVLAAMVVALPSSRRRTVLRSLGLLLPPFLGLLLVLLLSAGVRWYVGRWYYAPFALYAAIVAGLVTDFMEGLIDDLLGPLRRLAREPPRWTLLAPRAGLYALLASLVLYYATTANFRSVRYTSWWQADMYDAALWIDQNTPEDTRVGAFNAGIVAYFSERPVVNLDGVMNRPAYKALRDCRTGDFIRSSKIDYVADSLAAFTMASCGLTLDKDTVVVVKLGSVLIVRTTDETASSHD
jgi:4-amino-4-deoxy-L-arabinose transferase-like glycosyltransferase